MRIVCESHALASSGGDAEAYQFTKKTVSCRALYVWRTRHALKTCRTLGMSTRPPRKLCMFHGTMNHQSFHCIGVQRSARLASAVTQVGDQYGRLRVTGEIPSVVFPCSLCHCLPLQCQSARPSPPYPSHTEAIPVSSLHII